MSTFTAIGPRLDLVGPRPQPPRHSLLETPGVVVDEDGGRWLNGVNLLGYPDDTPSIWEVCSDGTFRVKDEGTERPQALFDPFVGYLPVTCSTLGLAPEGELADMAEAVLNATLSFAVEQALAQGGVSQANPYLGDANLVSAPIAGTAVNPESALAFLEDAIGQTGRQGMIHATPAIASSWQTFYADRGQEEPLRTINGTPVVIGSGYIGTDPDAETSPSEGVQWAFATGPVEVRLGPFSIPSLRTALDRAINEVTFRAERPFLVTWDTALQVGVLVDWNTT